MQLSIGGKQLDVRDTVKEHVQQRLSNGVSKHFDRALDAKVHFSRDGHQIRTEISVHAGSGITLHSHATNDDMMQSFDAAADRIEKRLRRLKKRLVNHHTRKGDSQVLTSMARQVVMSEESGAGTESESDTSQGDGGPVTIAETTMEIHNLTVSEATMRLELGQLPLLMFRNSAHGGVNVVYRRDDGHIGWIDPIDSGSESDNSVGQ